MNPFLMERDDPLLNGDGEDGERSRLGALPSISCGSPQAIYEVPMDSQCISHGFQWIPQGFIMDALWIFCGILVHSLLILYELSLDSS